MFVTLKNIPKGWNTAELGDLISIISGHGFKKSEYSNYGVKLLQIANVSFQETQWNEIAYLPEHYLEGYPKLALTPGDLVMALNRPILGRRIKFAILASHDCPAILYQRVGKIVISSKQIIRDFLFQFMQTDYFYHELKSRLSGSDQPYINPTELVKIRVLLPPIAEQKRIATIAQKADRLRRTRRYTLELSDSYLRSVFLEMFGDLVSNSLGWKFEKLGNIAEIASGVTKGQKFNGKTTITVPYLRVANVQDGFLDLSEIKMIEALPSDVEALKLLSGDVLMTEGGDYDKLGRGAIWRGEIKTCIHQNHIFRVRTNQRKVLPIFFASLLVTKFAKDYFLRCSKQTTNLATINMTQLKELPVPLIPLPLQEKFAQIVQRFERIRIQQREADRQAEHLFQTILHRAFRGEL